MLGNDKAVAQPARLLHYGSLLFDMTTAQFIIPNHPKEIHAPPTNIKKYNKLWSGRSWLKTLFSAKMYGTPIITSRTLSTKTTEYFFLIKKIIHAIKDATATSIMDTNSHMRPHLCLEVCCMYAIAQKPCATA